MAGEQSFKAVINDTKPSAKGRSFSVEITGSNFNHFLGKKIGDSVEGMFVGDAEQSLSGYKLQITGGPRLCRIRRRWLLAPRPSIRGV